MPAPKGAARRLTILPKVRPISLHPRDPRPVFVRVTGVIYVLEPHDRH
jgi:hypothetical protein